MIFKAEPETPAPIWLKFRQKTQKDSERLLGAWFQYSSRFREGDCRIRTGENPHAKFDALFMEGLSKVRNGK